MQEDIERAKIIQNADLPKEAKSIGAMGALLGASNESIIHGMVDVISTQETSKAEAEASNNYLNKPVDYNEIESIIHDMLTESTGTNMLDSGGLYGRSWQRNRLISDFRQLEPFTTKINMHKDNTYDISFTVNVFHYLTHFLDVNETTKTLEQRYEKFLNKNEDLGYYQSMEEFIEKELGLKTSK